VRPVMFGPTCRNDEGTKYHKGFRLGFPSCDFVPFVVDALIFRPYLDVPAFSVGINVDQREGRSLATTTRLDGDHVLVVLSADLQFRDRA
jgi:hypothetical protein